MNFLTMQKEIEKGKKIKFEQDILINHTKFFPILEPKQFNLYHKEMLWAFKEGQKYQLLTNATMTKKEIDDLDFSNIIREGTNRPAFQTEQKIKTFIFNRLGLSEDKRDKNGD